MKTRRGPSEDVAGPLRREEWDFDSVPVGELVACCYWEYARESPFVRDLRKRSWQYWKPRFLKERWWNAPEDKGIKADLLKVESIGYPAEVFLRGIARDPLPRREAPAMENKDTICKGFTSNAEKIALLRKAHFADVDELEKSNQIQLPPNNW